MTKIRRLLCINQITCSAIKTFAYIFLREYILSLMHTRQIKQIVTCSAINNNNFVQYNTNLLY